MSQADGQDCSGSAQSVIVRATAGRAFAILGTLVASALVIGVVAFCVNMVALYRAFPQLGVSEPKDLVPHLGKALVPVVAGASIGVFGLVTSLLTTLVSSFRSRWFFWSSLVLSFAYLFIPPFGTLAGIAFAVVLLLKRREFRAASPGLGAA